MKDAPSRPTAALAVALALAACSSPGGPPLPLVAAEINMTRDPVAALAIGIGDTLAVRFENNPTWDQDVIVAPDGSASFLGIDRVEAAGHRTEELDRALTERYSELLGLGDTVSLSVNLTERAPRTISVLGEVQDPGVYPLPADGHVTILDALALGGGFVRSRAYLGSVVLLRWDADQGRQLSWTVDMREEHWSGPAPVFLQAHDLVYVPNTAIDDVNIWVDKYIRQLIPYPQFLVYPGN